MTSSHEPTRMRAALAAILLVAAGLRFWGLGQGIPYSIGVDEPQVLNRALTMMRTGDFNPHFFDYPALYLYLQLVLACARFMYGAMMGYWSSLSEVPLPEYVAWGRALTAAFGTLTVFVLYRIGHRWSHPHALLAAGLLAVVPLHVRESQYILTDVPTTFFVTLTALLALRAAEVPTIVRFVVAGAAAGLAAGTKYPGAIALLLPLAAAASLRAAQPSRIVAAAVTVGGAAAAFLLAAPYTLLDLPAFLDGYGRLMASYTARPGAEPAWSLYLKHLRLSVEWPAFLAIGAGLVIAIARAVKGPDRLRWAMAAGFPLLFYWTISRQSLVFGRYLLPLVPFACLLAAIAAIAGVALLSRLRMQAPVRIAAIVTIVALVVLPSAVTAVSFNVTQSRESTAAQAYAWLNANTPAGTSIAVEGTDLVLMYSPRYKLTQLPQLRLRSHEFFVERGITYLVASSQIFGQFVAAPSHFPQESGDYRALFRRTQEVARFVPSDEHPGAELRILKVVP